MGKKIERMVNNHFSQWTQYGDWYMLQLIGKNVDTHYFNYFVVELNNAPKTVGNTRVGWQNWMRLPQMTKGRNYCMKKLEKVNHPGTLSTMTGGNGKELIFKF